MNVSQDNYVYRQIISFDKYHNRFSSGGGGGDTGQTGSTGPTGQTGSTGPTGPGGLL